MRTDRLFALLLMIALGGCLTPAYLPSFRDIDTNEHGAFIRVNSMDGSKVQGELIAVKDSALVILSDQEGRCIGVPIKGIDRFVLRYARPRHYGWTIPLGIAISIFHGYYAVLTLPANLVTTIMVTVSGENAFRYTKRDISFDKMYMFARYPQGIPAGVEMSDIN
ncbi:MAG: hypothetical protein RL213_1361 [Bacteroidota bacterium]|jgi:hypothetical protein